MCACVPRAGKKANKYFRFDADKKEFVYINELSQKEKEHVQKVRTFALRAAPVR